MLSRLKIQGDSSKIYDVDLVNKTCNCSTPIPNCVHLKKAVDFVENKFENNKDLLISSFIAEVRRCDVSLGLTWAHIMNKFLSSAEMHEILCTLCLSETRNIALYTRLITKQHSPIQMAELLIRSYKRWHIDGWLKPFIDGYLLQIGEHEFKEDKIRRTIFNSSDLSDWYACAFAAFRSGDDLMVKAFVEAVNNRLFAVDRLPHRQEIRTILNGGTLSVDALFFICELATDFWKVDRNEYFSLEHEYIKPTYIPKFEGYIFDQNNRGIMKLYDNWFSFSFKKSIAMDLRWNDLVWGILWRYYAVKQFGPDIKNIDWKQVTIDDAILSDYIRLDACLNRMFYGTVHFWNLRLDDDVLFKKIIEDNNHHIDLIEPKDFFRKRSA